MPVGGAKRVVYLGTPDVAVPPLRALHEAGVNVVLVVTRVDKRRGRGSALSPSPVKIAAGELGIPVSHALDDVLRVGADLGVVVAYGRIIPPHVLQALALINVHFSLLPRWRGAAPVERAILAGDERTGVCIMRVEEGLDTGVVYDEVVVPIRDDHTLSSLRHDLVVAALPPLLRAVMHGVGEGKPQVGDATTAAKIAAHEMQIRFTMTAGHIVALTRLETAWFDHAGVRVRVISAHVASVSADDDSVATDDHSVAGDIVAIRPDGVFVRCADGVVCLTQVQPAGKKSMAAWAWANGARLSSSLA